MISATVPQEFTPLGRQYEATHPGHSHVPATSSSTMDHGLPLVKALKDISIRDIMKKDSWKLRKNKSVTGSEFDEELYISGHTVVWSCGTQDAAGYVVKSFTMDTPVLEALWCSFLLPKEITANNNSGHPSATGEEGFHCQSAVCVVEANSVSVFTSEGKDYNTALPFPVSKTWPMKNGLLFERAVTQLVKPVSVTPKRDQQPLPVLFSMLHPLDEVAPVICRTGGMSSASKVSYVTETSQSIVMTWEEPSLVMTYDHLLSAHAVWNLRGVKPEEGYLASGGSVMDMYSNSSVQHHLGTPGFSQSGSLHLSRHTLSSQSPSLSPFRSYGSRVNSPVGGLHSRVHSPAGSFHLNSRSHSPSLVASSLLRLHSPSPSVASPAGCPRTPLSFVSGLERSYSEIVEPLAPEACLDHLWTETAQVPRDGLLGKASKAFLYKDVCGQQYLCYMVSYRHHLRCVKMEASNDQRQLIFGAVTIIQAQDAIPLESLNMVLILDMDNSPTLYTGTTKMTKIHVGGLPTPFMSSIDSIRGPAPSTPFGSPPRISSGPMTSSRPPSAMDARFEDEVQLLSPVPTESDDSSQLLDTSLIEDISFQPSMANQGSIASLRDPQDNRFTLEAADGSLWRTSLPVMTSSPFIRLCLAGLRHVLPKDLSILVYVKWYSTRNAPGSINGQSEWIQFCYCLLSMIGYEVTTLSLGRQVETDSSHSPVIAPKKAKPSDQGSDEDWLYLLNSDHHKTVCDSQGHLLGLKSSDEQHHISGSTTESKMDTIAPLFHHLPAILYALHLVYEELKLDSLFLDDLEKMASVLLLLASDIRCQPYCQYYSRDHPNLHDTNAASGQLSEEMLTQLQYPPFLSKEPPSVYQWLYDYLRGSKCAAFPLLSDVCSKTRNIISLYVILQEGASADRIWDHYLRPICGTGSRATVEMSALNSVAVPPSSSVYEQAVLIMTKLDPSLKDCVVYGASLPLREAIFHCRANPPGDWPEEAYILIDRQDLARQKRMNGHRLVQPRDFSATTKTSREEEDGMEYLDTELLNLRFSEDLRVQEVRRLLQSSKPVRVAVTQRPEVSDHDFIEELERFLYATCVRTMALPVGRGMFTLSTYHPVPTETLPIPKLCLTGRAPPRNTTVDLTHIDTPPNMNAWPQFHNGVAAGLRIANSSQLDSTWILYNKPKSNELTNEHAGFLMGLGLNKHLSTLAMLSVHDYLCRGHEMTSVGLLLGIAAGKRGTMDESTTRLLSIHVAALLPLTSTELDVPHNVQVAAVLGIGLSYQATAHRHIAEVLLSEIGRPPGPEMENCTDRESYSLSAGLALGLVMLGRGSEAVGLSDLNMADQLYHYMVGGHKRPGMYGSRDRLKTASYQIKEGDSVNVDVTSPGATLALGMMFFKSNNSAVAEWLKAPDTQFLLDFVRPDFLMLRMISYGLVMWDSIEPTEDWIKSNIPPIVLKYAFNRPSYGDDPDCDIDFETMSQAYCNIVAGSCMAIGLKYAGTGHQSAFQYLLKFVKTILKVLPVIVMVEQAGKSTVENCLVVMVLATAMVMAGTGNLEVLRLCRHLRSRVGASHSHVLYGSHMAISMALGLLFLGGGRCTLGTKPEDVAAMLCAFFPKFPLHSNDNRYHLQAFRHLYVLAVQPRVILPRDVDTGCPCYVPIEVTLKEGTQEPFKTMAPCVLPDLQTLKTVTVMGPRYWPISFQVDRNWNMLRQLLQGTGYLYVKQRAGHLSYMEDPKGYRGLLAQCVTEHQSMGSQVKLAEVKSFSSDPRILAFAQHFCSQSCEEEEEIITMLSKILHECVIQEKPEVLSTYIAMDKVVRQVSGKGNPLQLWQLKLILAYYDRRSQQAEGSAQSLMINLEFLAGVKNRVNDDLGQTVKGLLNPQQKPDHWHHLLACFMTWYDLPNLNFLTEISQEGGSSVASLYSQLKPLGLSIPTVRQLSSLLLRQGSR